MSKVFIDIAAEFTGKPAFKKAETSVSTLEKTVGKLGKQFASLFAAQKIAAFGKASVQAFAADQKSAALLTQTVKNLGLAFASPQINDFIQNLEKTSGVVDDQLRPAMQKLLQTTGSVARSQELLKLALDTSKGSGVDLLTVASDLGNAYVGNNKGLKKYNIGLSAAELKTASFAKVSERFNVVFGGQTAAALNTVQGQFDLLNVSIDNAQEVIGGSLIQSVQILSGQTGFGALNSAIEKSSTDFAAFTIGLSDSIAKMKDLIGQVPMLDKALGLLADPTGTFGRLGKIFQYFVNKGNTRAAAGLAPASANSHLAELSASSNAAKQKAAEAAATKRAKELAKAQTAQTKALKDQALLKKQSALFDMQQIEIIAALKGQLSDEDRKRLELQLALLQGDEETAKRLTTQIANAIDQTGQLSKYLNSLTANNDPFKAWLDSLEKIAAKAGQVVGSAGGTGIGGGTGGGTGAGNTQNFPQKPVDYSGFVYDPSNVGQSGSGAQFGASTPWAQAVTNSQYSQPIVVQIDGKTIASSLANQSASGVSSFIDRNLGYFTN